MGRSCATCFSIRSRRRPHWNSPLLPRSKRYPWTAPPNRLAIALEQQQGQLIDLSNANPTRASLELPPLEAIAPGAYAPQSAGALATREAVCAYYREDFAAHVEPSQVVLTTSTSEAYSYCFKLIADAGSEILIPEPSYPLLHFLIEADGLVPVPYPLHYAGGEWHLDREALLERITASTKAVIVVHPNNPTGHFLNAADREWLAAETQDRLWILSDEVFASYDWRGGRTTLASACLANTFVLSGLSKICALPQMKLGWIVLPDSATPQRDMELIADTYLSVSTPIQSAAVGWLARRAEFQAPIRRRCLKGITMIGAALRDQAWSALPVDAGWSIILKGPAHLDEEQFILSLIERGFSAHPGFYYDLPFAPSVVLSLLTPPEDLRAGLAAITAS